MRRVLLVQVEGCLLVGEEVHDLGEVELVYRSSDMKAIEVSTKNQISGRIPTQQRSVSTCPLVERRGGEPRREWWRLRCLNCNAA